MGDLLQPQELRQTESHTITLNSSDCLGCESHKLVFDIMPFNVARIPKVAAIVNDLLAVLIDLRLFLQIHVNRLFVLVETCRKEGIRGRFLFRETFQSTYYVNTSKRMSI